MRTVLKKADMTPCKTAAQVSRFKLSILSMVVTGLLCVVLPTGHASDIEIYKAAAQDAGKTSIFLMLDTSGSMGISSLVLPKNNEYGSPGDVDRALCDRVRVPENNQSGNNAGDMWEWAYNLKDTRLGSPTYNRTSFYKTVIIGGTAIPYYVRGCSKNGVIQYDRLSRLKDAILPLLASSELKDSTIMGLGQFSSKTELTIGTATNRLTDGHSGRVLVANAALSATQRIKIAREIAAIKSLDTTTNEDGTPNASLKLSSRNYPNVTKASSGTPTVHAYAEAAAYMMGTGTGTGGKNSGKVEIIYDGYMVKQRSNDDEQVYFICVELGGGTTNALGATVKQCPSNWPHDKYDSVKKTTTDSAIIFKPNGLGGWTKVGPTELKNAVGPMDSAWNIYTKLPAGWRLDGWMKVDNEPMDIEPVVGTVWTYADNIRGLVSYRTSPFSLKAGEITVIKQGFQDCPSGSTVLSSWNSLCIYEGPFYREASSSSQCTNGGLIMGQDPVPNARNPDGTLNTNETYNQISRGLVNLRYERYNSNRRKCVQDRYAVARPWGNITTVETGAIQNNIGGMAYSVEDSKNGSIYKQGGTANSCDGNGIYFLTDGAPNSTNDIMARTIMNTSLNSSGYQFSAKPTGLGVLQSPVLKSNLFDGETGGWEYIGEYAKKLFDRTKNPAGMQIKTAVVGFGSSFAGIPKNADGSYQCENAPNQDAKNACFWGSSGYGEGGFYYAENSDDIKNSIINFVKELNNSIPSISTGSSTIPLDDLNPAVVQPYAYFPQFEPKVAPSELQQIWFGNLKKYYVLNNGVYSSPTNANDNTVVVKKSELQDLPDIWVTGNYPSGGAIFSKGGALSRVILGTTTNAVNETVTGRKLLTDYDYDSTKKDKITKNLDLTQIKYTYTTDAKTKTDTFYASALMGLLGYKIDSGTNTNGLDLSSVTPTVRQMGSVYHSKPVLLTQSGKAVAVKDAITGKITVGSENREDYILFGTTQGLIQVVDANTGNEKFAFVPKEIIEKQSETFKQGGGGLAGGKNNLYYGMDGEWVAHTVYVTKSDGTLTVKGTTQGQGSDAINLAGKQWAYGGMRMGGRSYYSLDLTDINNPKVKFQIDPSTGMVYSKVNPSGKSFSAISNMGQSWSKPTIGYVNWKGQRKLVMIVGGGYDAGGNDGDGLKEATTGIRTGYAGYEGYNYKQSNKIGAGVYMFDADTGDLLWSADSNSNVDLKYSVVSQIRAIDRNNDGIIDHLYYGDLAGQAFRTDFKNDGGNNFITQTNKILDLHADDGTSPRFYTLPAFTAHNSSGSTSIYGGNIVVVTFVSGNQSSPLLATNDSPSKTSSDGLKLDAAYGIFDYDVYPSTAGGRYPSSNLPARTVLATTLEAAGIKKLRYVNDKTDATIIDKTNGWGGWYYPFKLKFDGETEVTAGVIKALTTPLALEGSLYVTQYDASNSGTTSSCGAGVKGHSFTQRICLPGGVCKDGEKYSYNLGSGIVTLNVGSVDGDPTKRSIVVPDPNDTCPAGQVCTPAAKDKFIKTGGALRFIPNLWYEKYTQ